jgi:hypothetical protein
METAPAEASLAATQATDPPFSEPDFAWGEDEPPFPPPDPPFSEDL